LAGAVGVGRSGVCAWETFTVIQEISQVPGIARIGIDFLRVGRAADMPHEASSPTLTQVHTLGVANAIVTPGAGTASGISDIVILPANAQQVCEGQDEVVFVRLSYGISLGNGEADPRIELMGHEVSGPIIIGTPSVTPVSTIQEHSATTPSRLVNHVVTVVTATQGHIAQGAGFGDRSQNVAPAQTTHAAAALRLTKIIIPGGQEYSNQANTVSVRRNFILNVVANCDMPHLATPSGVATANLNVNSATQGHITIPAASSFLARTFPFAGTQAMLVAAPTMAQNIVTSAGTFEGQYFGSKIAGVTLNSFPVGSSGTQPNATSLSIRFRAEKTAAVSAASIVAVGGAGFALGNAVLEARILRDDNSTDHLPVDSQRTGATTSGTQVIFTGVCAHIGAASDRVAVSGTSGVKTFTWSSGKPVITKNLIYHLEIRNCNLDPGNNWCSVDTLAYAPGIGLSVSGNDQVQPGVTNADLGLVRRNSNSTWSARSQTPIFAIWYDGEDHQGQGYSNAPETPMQPINGPLSRVREKFVPNANLRVNTVGYRVGKWQGSQPVQMRLIRESDSAVLVSGAAHPSYFPLISNQADSRLEHRWVSNTFVSSFSLAANVTASLELQTTANSEYRAYTLAGVTAFPASSKFWQGRAEWTNDGTAWNVLGSTENDLQFYLGLGSAAPAPICKADTFEVTAIGALRTVSAQELLANDENPSGMAATTALPTGVNTLTLVKANSASNCTATLVTASQIIRVTAAATTGSFTYVAQDIFGQRSSARASFTALTPEFVKKLMLARVLPGLGASAAGVDEIYGTPYNFVRFRVENRDAFGDANLDGHLDSGAFTSSTFNNLVSRINSGPQEYVALDWEIKVSPFTANTDYWEDDASNRNGTTRQTAALADGIAIINELKSRCPGKKFGWYFLPKQYGEASLSAMPTNLANTPTSMSPLWQVVDFISPDIYQRFKITAAGTGADEISQASDLTRMTNFANLCLQCAEQSGRNIPVIPFVSDNYLSNSGNQYNNTEIPLQEMYLHIKNFMQTELNGVKPAGVFWWESNNVSLNFDEITETDVKVMYQAINLLTFDTSMPRPT
jgi:hypothetical protein